MPQIVQLPSVPNTGFAELGGAIARVGNDVAQNRRYDERRAEQRSNQLADVASAREYQTGERETIREERLADTAAERELHIKEELIRLGFLAPDKRTAALDDPAVIAAAEEFAKSALAVRYKAAMDAGDLTYADLGDQTKVEAGLAKFSERASTNTRFSEDQRANAVTGQSQLATEYQELQQRARELDAALGQPQPEPSQQQVVSAAQQIVRASKQPLNDKSISEAIPEAQQKLRENALIAWGQRKQELLIQRQLLDNQLRDNAARQNTATNRFGVVGVPAAAPATAAVAPARQAPDLAAAQAAFAAQLARPAAPAAPAAPVGNSSPYAGLFAADQAQQKEVLSTENARLADPFNEAMDRKAAIQEQLKVVQAGLNPAAANPRGSFSSGSPAAPSFGRQQNVRLNPQEQEQLMTSLQQQLAAIDQEVETTRRTMLGLDARPTTVAAPNVSTSQGTTPTSIPNWWSPPQMPPR